MGTLDYETPYYIVNTNSTTTTNYPSYYRSKGYPMHSRSSLDDIDLDALWEKMYIKVKTMWFACPSCDSANAIGNPVCCQCGAPLGSLHK